MSDNTSLIESKKPATFPEMLAQYKGQIAQALPRHFNPERMLRLAMTAFRQNPALRECSPGSVFAAVIQSSQLGLEVGLNGRAYLVPYKGECQFIPGWKGLVELVNRTGRATCWTGAVFEGDEFEYQLGDNPFVRHLPGDEDDPDKLTYTYAVGRIKGNEYPIIEVWNAAKLRKHFNRYNKVGNKHYAHTNWEMYCRKIPLMQVIKYLPASPELEAAVSLNDAAEAGSMQGMGDGAIKDIIAGTHVPPPEGGDDDRQATPNKPATATDSVTDAVRLARENAKRAAAATARKGETIDPTTGEISPAAPGITYAKIMDAINHAKTLTGVDEALDLARTSIKDQDQIVEITQRAVDRKGEIAVGDV